MSCPWQLFRRHPYRSGARPSLSWTLLFEVLPGNAATVETLLSFVTEAALDDNFNYTWPSTTNIPDSQPKQCWTLHQRCRVAREIEYHGTVSLLNAISRVTEVGIKQEPANVRSSRHSTDTKESKSLVTLFTLATSFLENSTPRFWLPAVVLRFQLDEPVVNLTVMLSKTMLSIPRSLKKFFELKSKVRSYIHDVDLEQLRRTSRRYSTFSRSSVLYFFGLPRNWLLMCKVKDINLHDVRAIKLLSNLDSLTSYQTPNLLVRAVVQGTRHIRVPSFFI